MAQACRDCSRCTESTVKRVLATPWRVVKSPLAVPANMLKKKCRVCGHPLSWHEKMDGRFAD